MKRTILVLSFAVMAFIGISLTSCCDTKCDADDSKTENVKTEDTKKEKVKTTVYQCPMKCEGDKTYSEPGNCPKCGMEIKEISGENHEGHNH